MNSKKNSYIRNLWKIEDKYNYIIHHTASTPRLWSSQMYIPYPPIGIVFLGDMASNPVCFGGSGKQTLQKKKSQKYFQGQTTMIYDCTGIPQ